MSADQPGHTVTPQSPATATLSGWLNRPLLDLGPAPAHAPFYLTAIDFCYRNLAESDEAPWLALSIGPAFREELVAHPALSRYAVADPRGLALELRTSRWQLVVDLLDAFHSQPTGTKAHLCWLTSKLGFYDFVGRLIPEETIDAAGKTPADAELAYLRAWSRFRCWADGQNPSYSLAEFQAIAQVAPVSKAKVDAHYQMVVQHAKFTGDLAAITYWQGQHKLALSELQGQIDPFVHGLLESRFWRVAGFLPQMRHDRAGVARDMERAEHVARSLPRDTYDHQTAAAEILYPVIESRMQEFLWADELDSATHYADELVQMSPLSARGWLHHGEVMARTERFQDALVSLHRAICLAPPGREHAWFLAGQCYEHFGQSEMARFSYLQSLENDPLAIGAASQLNLLAGEDDDTDATIRWARSREASLQSSIEASGPPVTLPYHVIASPVSAR